MSFEVSVRARAVLPPVADETEAPSLVVLAGQLANKRPQSRPQAHRVDRQRVRLVVRRGRLAVIVEIQYRLGVKVRLVVLLRLRRAHPPWLCVNARDPH